MSTRERERAIESILATLRNSNVDVYRVGRYIESLANGTELNELNELKDSMEQIRALYFTIEDAMNGNPDVSHITAAMSHANSLLNGALCTIGI